MSPSRAGSKARAARIVPSSANRSRDMAWKSRLTNRSTRAVRAPSLSTSAGMAGNTPPSASWCCSRCRHAAPMRGGIVPASEIAAATASVHPPASAAATMAVTLEVAGTLSASRPPQGRRSSCRNTAASAGEKNSPRNRFSQYRALPTSAHRRRLVDDSGTALRPAYARMRLRTLACSHSRQKSTCMRVSKRPCPADAAEACRACDRPCDALGRMYRDHSSRCRPHYRQPRRRRVMSAVGDTIHDWRGTLPGRQHPPLDQRAIAALHLSPTGLRAARDAPFRSCA